MAIANELTLSGRLSNGRSGLLGLLLLLLSLLLFLLFLLLGLLLFDLLLGLVLLSKEPTEEGGTLSAGDRAALALGSLLALLLVRRAGRGRTGAGRSSSSLLSDGSSGSLTLDGLGRNLGALLGGGASGNGRS